eukprot:scaffold19253_cov124-Isochrysis_galbana.AAC.8
MARARVVLISPVRDCDRWPSGQTPLCKLPCSAGQGGQEGVKGAGGQSALANVYYAVANATLGGPSLRAAAGQANMPGQRHRAAAAYCTERGGCVGDDCVGMKAGG